MQIAAFNQALQNFVRALDSEKSNDIDVTTANGQELALDYLTQLMQYCVWFNPNNIPKGLHVHPEFFALPYVEEFFADLFANLHKSLLLKAESVFFRGLASACQESRSYVSAIGKTSETISSSQRDAR